MIIFRFLKFFVDVDGISSNDLFQANAFSKGYNGKRAKCASVFLQYLLNFVKLHYMLLIMINIVYHDLFVSGAVVFDRVGQLSECAV